MRFLNNANWLVDTSFLQNKRYGGYVDVEFQLSNIYCSASWHTSPAFLLLNLCKYVCKLWFFFFFNYKVQIISSSYRDERQIF